MVTARSVNQSDLCAHLPGGSSLDAKKRQVERGCRDPQLTGPVFLAFLLALLPPGKLLLSMDRTTWERGESPLNLLVLGVVLHGYTVPLVWTALDHDGNSGTVSQLVTITITGTNDAPTATAETAQTAATDGQAAKARA